MNESQMSATSMLASLRECPSGTSMRDVLKEETVLWSSLAQATAGSTGATDAVQEVSGDCEG